MWLKFSSQTALASAKAFVFERPRGLGCNPTSPVPACVPHSLSLLTSEMGILNESQSALARGDSSASCGGPMAFQLSPPLEEVGSLIWGFLARPRLSPAPETQNSGCDAELEKSKMKRKSLCPEEADASEGWSKEGRQASYQELQASERGMQGAGCGL